LAFFFLLGFLEDELLFFWEGELVDFWFVDILIVVGAGAGAYFCEGLIALLLAKCCCGWQFAWLVDGVVCRAGAVGDFQFALWFAEWVLDSWIFDGDVIAIFTERFVLVWTWNLHG
jgi:hypothetical protein